MSDDLQVTVMAHGAAQETFNRHLPLWLAHKAKVVVVCPENDPIESIPLERMKFGDAERAGPQAHARLRHMHEYLCTSGVQYHLICEYDSFLLTDPVLSPGLWGIVQMNKQSPDFLAHRYPNPPWLIDNVSLAAMWDVAERYPLLYEGGEADRYWAALAELAGVPILSYRPGGFTKGTITVEDYPALQAAIKAGARAFHGIKDQYTLAFALSLLS